MSQHDMEITNSDANTGLTFRAAINAALQALVSNNAGATEPPTPYAYMWWPDTTTGLMKIRNAANNAWITIGTLADAYLGLMQKTGANLAIGSDADGDMYYRASGLLARIPNGIYAIMSNFWGDKPQRLIEAHASDHTKITVNKGAYYIPILVGTTHFLISAAVHVSSVDDIDTGAVEAGKDYYVYACNNAGSLVFKTSLASTYPAGFNADTSRKIGGFHTLCTAVGTISGHTLTGYAQKDILPASIWDLKHRARCGVNAGMVYDTKSGIWVDIYLASGTGASTVSANGGTISDTRDWNDFVDDGGAVGKRLLTDSEFQLIAAGSNEETNIAGSADPVTTGGHSDTAGRRMISNIGCEDCCGAMLQWLLDQSAYVDASIAAGWYNLPGSKGQIYRPEDTGDIKLLAGGLWSYAAYAGSRCRNASGFRWTAATASGGRFASEPL